MPSFAVFAGSARREAHFSRSLATRGHPLENILEKLSICRLKGWWLLRIFKTGLLWADFEVLKALG
jgi:hypothetical protein